MYAGYYAGSKAVKTFEQLAGTVGRGSDYTAGKDEGTSYYSKGTSC